MKHFGGLLALSMVAALVPGAATAQSCEPRACVPDVFFPQPFDPSTQASTSVPANMQTFLFRRHEVRAEAGDAGLLDAGSSDGGSGLSSAPRILLETPFGSELELPTTSTQKDGWLRITPSLTLAPKSLLHVALSDPCSDLAGASVRAFEITESAPLPTQLGTLDVTDPQSSVSWRLGDGSCGQDDSAGSASARIALTLSDEARPYADVLRFALIVDGVRRPPFAYSQDDPDLGTSVYGAGVDFLASKCLLDVVDKRAVACAHGVQMVGILPDGTELLSPAVAVDVCSAPWCWEDPPSLGPCHQVGYAPCGGYDDSPPVNRGSKDAGTKPHTPADASMAATPALTDVASRPPSGCALAGSTSAVAPSWSLLVLLLLVLRRGFGAARDGVAARHRVGGSSEKNCQIGLAAATPPGSCAVAAGASVTHHTTGSPAAQWR
ncbi:MAG: hypothetical protein JWN04_6784 [Myxococcaceae bacterium]|nr:hypothetical protein [Myxococcaceae bacterium]